MLPYCRNGPAPRSRRAIAQPPIPPSLEPCRRDAPSAMARQLHFQPPLHSPFGRVAKEIALRTVVVLSLICGLAGLVVRRSRPPQPPKAAPGESTWRRTADGWEKTPLRRPPLVAARVPHPGLVAALQGMLSVAALLAFTSLGSMQPASRPAAAGLSVSARGSRNLRAAAASPSS